MKILLDENLPKRLRNDFPGHEVYTIREKLWNGKKNGELLSLLTEEDFQILMTFDKNLPFQQNFSKYPVKVLILDAEDNTYATLKELVPLICEELTKELLPGTATVKKE
jgi:predicted nuclease of predicted toxin-antitoxin system